mmetsp:Transcript_19923/g.41623  ORF Transcript_19923/g.41623 Transcript_19923/m.41623 type:complete len:273 (-) Transcript_19923:12-830(-)
MLFKHFFFSLLFSLVLLPAQSFHLPTVRNRSLRTSALSRTIFSHQRPPRALFAAKDASSSSTPQSSTVIKISKSIRRSSWISWWLLLLLNISTLSTLLFSRTLLTTTSSQLGSGIGGGIFLTVVGGILNVFQVPWMWGYARMSRRLLKLAPPSDYPSTEEARDKYTLTRSLEMINRATKIGVTLAIIGLLVTIVGGEQIVGSLTAKALMHQNYLTSSGTASAAVATQAVSVVDLLTIQANINTLAGLIWGTIIGMLIRWRQGGRCKRALEKL